MATLGNCTACNETTNTVHSSSAVLTKFEIYFPAVIMIIVIVAAVVGNILVFCAFARFRNLRNPTNFFIVNLAATDFLVGLLPAPFWACWILTGKPSRDQKALYKLWEMLDVVCGFASIMSLTFIAIDRYVCIKDALRYYAVMTAERVGFCLLFIWVYSLTAGLLAFLKIYIPGVDNWFRYYTFIAGFVVPLLIMVFCYANIYLETLRLGKQERQLHTVGAFVNENIQESGYVTILKHDSAEKKIANVSQNNSAYEADKCLDRKIELSYAELKHENEAAYQTSSMVGMKVTTLHNEKDRPVESPQKQHEDIVRNSRNSIDIGWGLSTKKAASKTKFELTSNVDTTSAKKLQRKKDDLKAAKTLSFILGAYLLTWTPFIISLMMFIFRPALVTLRLTLVTKCLHYGNSGLNPFLYTLLNRNFRTAFSKLLKREVK